MRPTILALIGALAAVGTLAGCGDEYGVTLRLQSDPPIEPSLGRDRAALGEGLAIGVRARALEDDEPTDDDLVVDLVSTDPTIVDVRRGIEPNTYVLIGRRAGTARIDARVDGEVAAPLEVVVEAQAPPAP